MSCSCREGPGRKFHFEKNGRFFRRTFVMSFDFKKRLKYATEVKGSEVTLAPRPVAATVRHP